MSKLEFGCVLQNNFLNPTPVCSWWISTITVKHYFVSVVCTVAATCSCVISGTLSGPKTARDRETEEGNKVFYSHQKVQRKKQKHKAKYEVAGG